MPYSNSLHAFPTWLCCWRIDSSLCETTSICKYDTNLKNARAPKKGTTYSRSEWTPFTVLRTNWQQPAWQRATICKCDTHLTSGTVFTAACCQHSLHANVTWLFGKCDMIIWQMWHDYSADVTWLFGKCDAISTAHMTLPFCKCDTILTAACMYICHS